MHEFSDIDRISSQTISMSIRMDIDKILNKDKQESWKHCGVKRSFQEGCQRGPRNRKTAQNFGKTTKPHRKVAKNRSTRKLSNITLISLLLPRKSYVDLKNEETKL